MSVRHEFTINGLHCANCANKIEAKISGIEGVNDVKLNFAVKKLFLSTEAQDIKGLLALINKIAGDIEPGVTLEKRKSGGRADSQTGKNERAARYLSIAASIIIFALALAADISGFFAFLLFAAAYLLVGRQVLAASAKNILRGKIFDENFLMSAATLGAFAIGEYPEAVAVMVFYQIGMFFENMAVERSRKSVSELMDIRPDFANVKKGDEIIRVSPEEVKTGDVIVIKPGEKVPLDGVVTEGNAALDTSALTGESAFKDAGVNDEVLSGFINKNGVLSVKVSKPFAESAVAKILNLVENAAAGKSKTEKFITKFAGYYTPAVVFCAVVLASAPPLLLEGALFSDWAYRAMVFLVVSCPCALVVSIPLGFFGGIGGASKNGILVKGSGYLEALNRASAFVFDKTGTLTKGVFTVSEITAQNSFTKESVLEYAAYAESYSNHPIAVSIRQAYGREIDKSRISGYKEHAGYGISACVGGRKILAGNAKFLEEASIKFEKSAAAGSVVYVCADGIFAGSIIVSDELRPDSKKTVAGLKKMGINRIVMLTGDVKEIGGKIASELGIEEVYADLLPEDKMEKVKEIKRSLKGDGNLIFVGDGINDAPVLAGSDIGAAMGGIGSDAAIEAADIVLMTDEPYKLITALKAAKKTKSVIWQNIIFALGVKAAVLSLGAAGMASMWEAVFADVGVTLIAVLNSMRALKVPK